MPASKAEARTDLPARLLAERREEIDSIDREIVELLSRRAAAALSLARAKDASGQPVFSPIRENEVLSRVRAENQGPLSDAALEAVYTEIISACRSLQSRLKVAFLGPAYTYSHQMALARFGREADFLPQPTLGEVFSAVESGRAAVAVVPVENSGGGGVGLTLDRFMESDLKICGELTAPISHVIMSRVRDESQVRRVYSHPQGLAQCRDWLARRVPGAETVETASTAAAAARAAEDPEGAAIGSLLAAQAYDLPLLASDIQDSAHNTTRFWVLGREDCPPTGTDKTTLMFVISHRPGSLYRALGHLASRGLNLTRIESRPTRQRPWEYAFFVDLIGHRRDQVVSEALEAMSGDLLWLKVLGSYPEGLTPRGTQKDDKE